MPRSRTLRTAARLSLGLTTLTAVAGLGLFAAPTAEGASCSGDPVTKTWRSPEKTSLGVSEVKTVQLIAATRHACAVKSVKVTVTTAVFDNKLTMAKYATQDDKDYWGLTYTISPTSVYNAEAGSWQTSYAAKRSAGTYTHDSASFKILRAAQLSTDATPEPVRKGQRLTVKGRLKRADWEDQKYHGFAGQSVELQLRSASGSYHRVKKVTTDSSGNLRTTVTAEAKGCYRYRYTGSSTTHAVTSSADCVDLSS